MTGEGTADQFRVSGESLRPVADSPEFGVRPVGDDSFPDAHVAVHRSSGAAAWGATRDDAIDHVERDVEHVHSSRRTGEIVETPGVHGGAPRVAGSRIGVLHIVTAYEDTGSMVETAAGFTGPLSVAEARTALDWAEAHPDELQRLRDERARTIERIKSEWDPIESSDDPDVATYRRPGSNTFALFGPDEAEP